MTEHGTQHVTNTLIALNIGVFIATLLSNQPDAAVARFAFSLDQLLLQRYETVLAAGFIHDGLPHLAYNMVFLWIFGHTCEDVFGPFRTATIYVSALIGGSLLFAAVFPGEAAIGASGAVSGLIAAGTLTVPGRPVYEHDGAPGVVGSLPIIVLAVAFLIPTAVNAFSLADNVAHIAHLGGGLVGAAYAIIYNRR